MLLEKRCMFYPWGLNSRIPANEFVFLKFLHFLEFNKFNKFFRNFFECFCVFSEESHILVHKCHSEWFMIRSSSIEIEKLMRFDLKKMIWWVARSSQWHMIPLFNMRNSLCCHCGFNNVFLACFCFSLVPMNETKLYLIN